LLGKAGLVGPARTGRPPHSVANRFHHYCYAERNGNTRVRSVDTHVDGIETSLDAAA
jgi:hypothetical protein